uniref:Uncharacterized protein n=1 Tax=Anguilla anguilla TaxID=7936 RepID=A0A0E9TYK5_ANGAN
MCVHPVWMSR